MSNVSQIYGTLRDSEPYIILNSTETEVSGNLSVLQNLDVCGNITFNNTDLSTALSNLVVDLTGGQDASFNNVDITGIIDAGINGTIKAANFNVGSKNVINGSAGVSCRSLEVKNQSNYICLMAQDSQVTISGSLILNNTDVSGKLTQIDASLVALASNGGGAIVMDGSGLKSTLANNNVNTDNGIAFGLGAGGGWSTYPLQGINTIAMGKYSGMVSQGDNAVALGHHSGSYNQGNNSVGLGYNAGYDNLGDNSIAIGYNAGYNNNNNNSNYILLNGTGNYFNTDQSNAFFVKPIRDAASSSQHNLVYDTGSGEITYKPEGDISGTITLSESDSLGNIDVNLASNTLTIDAKNVSYSTNYCIANDNTPIDYITITNFRKNAQTVIYLQADTSGNTIRGYTTRPLTNIKKNFADDIVLASGDIAILTITKIKDKYFLSASIFK